MKKRITNVLIYKKPKVITVIITIIVCIAALAVCFANPADLDALYVKSGMEEYYEKENTEYINFTLDDLGDYEDVYFQTAKTENYIFAPSYGSMLVADYTEEAFDKQLSALDKYEYHTEPITADFGHSPDYILPQPEFQINDWDFKVIKKSSAEYYYTYNIPKNFDFIAVNNSKHQIAYMTFCDEDLDIISCEDDERESTMIEFVEDHFKYDF